LLVDSVDELNIDKWPKPPRRKASDNKAKVEIDDIVNTFSFLDDSLLLDKLPTFVAVTVDKLPSCRIEEGDMRCILNKLDVMDKKLDNTDFSAANNLRSDLTLLKDVDLLKLQSNIEGLEKTLQSDIEARNKAVDSRVRRSVPPRPIPSAVNRDSAAGRAWSDLAPTPRPSPLVTGDDTQSDSDAGCHNNGMETDNGYTVVVNDRWKRKRIESLERNGRPKDFSSNLVSPGINVTRVKPKPKSVVGSNTNCTLKAANKRITEEENILR
jgi:hypothetical protein